MNHEQTSQKKYLRHRLMASTTAQLSQIERSSGAIAAWGKIVAGRAGAAGAECCWERRPQLNPEGYGCSRMVKQEHIACGDSGAFGIRFVDPVAAGIKTRLQPLRLHALPARLRSKQDRHQAVELSNNRLDANRNARKSTNIRESGNLATHQKIKNGSPATGRSTKKTSRHGTNDTGKHPEIRHFVPPWDEIACFGGFNRPTTGHLYRYAISRGILCD